MCSANDGVLFDFYNAGVPLKMSWTAYGSTNAWLVMDRNSNGTIDSGRELFGDFTQQPPAENRNGFLALAEYDKTQNGGTVMV